MKLLNFLVCTYFLSLMSTMAQDIHFSQYDNSPLNLDPALAGHFDGDYRFVLNHRNQWASVTVPYKTFSGFFDTKIPFEKLKKGTFGAGIILNNDKAGDSQLGIFQANVLLSYTQKMGNDFSNGAS